MRRKSDAQLRQAIADLGETGLDVAYETLLGAAKAAQHARRFNVAAADQPRKEVPGRCRDVPLRRIGMSIIVLDADLRVTWAWNGFDHLDVSRPPVLGEIVQPSSTGPTTAVPRLPAVDWLHINAVSWSPADGNLVLWVRHQDWVIKVDYRNGAGDGHVVWRLGQGGDFTLNSADPSAWFSHQHNAHFIDDTTMVLLDNGNTRRATDPAATSRGQVWTLDETNMTATPVLNADLGSYAGAVGSAQRLSNGNYHFNLGINGPEPPRPPISSK